jgi:hypothetical protein
MNTYTKIWNFQVSQRLGLNEQLPDNLGRETVAFLNAIGKKCTVRTIVFIEKQNMSFARRAFISIENTSNTESQYAVGV